MYLSFVFYKYCIYSRPLNNMNKPSQFGKKCSRKLKKIPLKFRDAILPAVTKVTIMILKKMSVC